ncbi:uncharacterized protein [Diadema antillarum]|uniref:uncharacterized protein n=1 Tax=Diadema antillarum TaxID=105358 RepID=UPI003A8B179E
MHISPPVPPTIPYRRSSQTPVSSSTCTPIPTPPSKFIIKKQRGKKKRRRQKREKLNRKRKHRKRSPDLPGLGMQAFLKHVIPAVFFDRPSADSAEDTETPPKMGSSHQPLASACHHLSQQQFPQGPSAESCTELPPSQLSKRPTLEPEPGLAVPPPTLLKEPPPMLLKEPPPEPPPDLPQLMLLQVPTAEPEPGLAVPPPTLLKEPPPMLLKEPPPEPPPDLPQLMLFQEPTAKPEPTEISSSRIDSDSDESELCDSDDADDEHWDIIDGGQEDVSDELSFDSSELSDEEEDMIGI